MCAGRAREDENESNYTAGGQKEPSEQINIYSSKSIPEDRDR
jgi:hypothetical protein